MYTSQKIFWEEKFSTGDVNLDFQHKYIFETFNKLSEAIAEEQDQKHISAILGRLRFYSDWHFAKEEECMENCKCPAAQANKDGHVVFREMFNNYYQEYVRTGGSREILIRAHGSLADWITQHILFVDTNLYACIQKSKTD